jgi:hypothetical protein
VTEATSVILGALVGAAAGLAGGGFAALASLRASQLAARAPLGQILCDISDALIGMNATRDTDEYLKFRREFGRRWRDFSVQQRILCPSERIANLMGLINAIGTNETDRPEALLDLAGQTMEKATQMVGAYGHSFFRYRARREEARIVRRWLDNERAKLLSEPVRAKLEALVPESAIHRARRFIRIRRGRPL